MADLSQIPYALFAEKDNGIYAVFKVRTICLNCVICLFSILHCKLMYCGALAISLQ